MTIGFWIKDECVLSLDSNQVHPLPGETVHLDLKDHKGYYRVRDLIWSYRHIPTQIPERCTVSDHRLEVHLEVKPK